jgi:hypothetical protein
MSHRRLPTPLNSEAVIDISAPIVVTGVVIVGLIEINDVPKAPNFYLLSTLFVTITALDYHAAPTAGTSGRVAQPMQHRPFSWDLSL